MPRISATSLCRGTCERTTTTWRIRFWETLDLVHGGQELDAIVDSVARVGRLACVAGPALFEVHDDSCVASPQRVQPPGLALGGSEEPALPLAVALGLVAEELKPGEHRRVFDVHRGRPPNALGELLDEFVVVLEVQIRLVAAEAYR